MIFIAFALKANAQSNPYLKGFVFDEYNKPVKNAQVTLGLSDTKLTNSDGCFVIEVKESNTLLQINYAGYISIAKRISTTKLNHRDTMVVYFKLEPSVNELNEIEIQYSKIERIFKETINIIDFEFYEDNILLLLKEKREYKLKLITKNDSVISELNLFIKPVGFYKDCYDNIHVKTTDSVYQFYTNLNGLQLMSGISSQQSLEFLEPCAASTTDQLIFKSMSTYKQVCAYFAIDKKQHVSKLIHIASDMDAERYREKFKQGNLADAIYAKHVMGDNTHEEQRFARDVQSSGMFFDKVLNAENYNPLFVRNDSIFIFDHVRDSLFIYSTTGCLIKSALITYHNQKAWGKNIIQDVKTKQMYIVFIKDGIVTLSLMDCQNGKLMPGREVSDHIYPEKMKIYNGNAYYFTKQSNDLGNSYLYRQKIK